MTLIAVVTKRAGFSLTFHSPAHRFAEIRPASGWMQRSWPEDVLVLDLGTAEATEEAVSSLRGSGVQQPVIVVANDSDGWDALFAEHPDLHLVSLPISPRSLLSTVDRAVRVAGRHSEPVESPQLASVATADTATTLAPGTSGDADAPLPAPRSLADSSRHATPPRPDVVLERLSAIPLAPTRHQAIDLVRDLQPLVGQLSRLPEVAEMARVRCSSVVSCEASAVLVPDGQVWRVAAGDRLRPLEERVQIEATHWLITEVVSQAHGVLIRDTDIARTKLSGAPLASWPNLLALPIPDVDAVVLLARRTKPFTRADLTTARHALGAAAPQLQEAVDARGLARAMAVFLDPIV